MSTTNPKNKSLISDALLKDPAMVNLGYDRIENDFYPTPTWITDGVLRLLDKIRFTGHLTTPNIWECAAGQGHMSKVMVRHNFRVYQTDLHPQHPDIIKKDFLADAYPTDMFIFTNPPYGKLAEKFVRHALEITKTKKGKVAMVLRHDWDCAKTRMDLFRDHPAYYGKITLTTRPRWIEGSTGAPRHNFAIFLWDWTKNASVSPVLLYMNKDMTC